MNLELYAYDKKSLSSLCYIAVYWIVMVREY